MARTPLPACNGAVKCHERSCLTGECAVQRARSEGEREGRDSTGRGSTFTPPSTALCADVPKCHIREWDVVSADEGFIALLMRWLPEESEQQCYGYNI